MIKKMVRRWTFFFTRFGNLCHPAEPCEQQRPVVSLNMERCRTKMDKGNLLANLIQNLVLKKVKVKKRRKDQLLPGCV
jgi:hypothetical protein